MNLTFHQTFTLECENLAKVLALVSENPSLTNVEIAEATGIGIGKNERQGKVQPTLDYAVYTGLLQPPQSRAGQRFRLTDVGKLVFDKDRWLKRPATQWVLHYHLSRPDGETAAWSYFVHEFLPAQGTFERATLESELGGKFPSVKVKSINPGVLLNTYTDSGALGRIRLVKEGAKRSYVRGQPYVPNVYTMAYLLAEIWDRSHRDRIMIDPAVLLEPGHLATTSGLGEQDLRALLDEMTASGIIDQMREAPPHQVIRRWDDKLGLLEMSYNEA